MNGLIGVGGGVIVVAGVNKLREAKNGNENKNGNPSGELSPAFAEK
jgi:hypothetical protein